MSISRRNFIKTMGLITAGIVAAPTMIVKALTKPEPRHLFKFPTIPGQRYRFSFGLKTNSGWQMVSEEFVATKKLSGVYALDDDEAEVIINDVALYNITPRYVLIPQPQQEQQIFAIDTICPNPVKSVELISPGTASIKTTTTLLNNGEKRL